jgi:hypothetical protein
LNIIKVKELEDCFDGSFMKEVLLDEQVSCEFIHYIGQFGELQYYPDFARPYFRIDIADRCIIKGVEGNRTFRLIIHRKHIVETIDLIEEHVSNYNKA